MTNNEGPAPPAKKAPALPRPGDPDQMETITNRGSLTYRTKVLPKAEAEAFARCLPANPNFARVEVTESARAKGEARFVVEFLPANPERIAEMVDRQQDRRQAKAEGEGRQYL